MQYLFSDTQPMKINNLFQKIFSFKHEKKHSWTSSPLVLEELTRKISELEAQNQKLKDKNKALLMLLDNTSRKLSSYGVNPLKERQP